MILINFTSASVPAARPFGFGCDLLVAALILLNTALIIPADSDHVILDGDLERDLLAIIGDYQEATVAVSVRDDATGVSLDLNGSRSFHAASTMKTPIAIEVFRQAYEGSLSLEDSLLVKNRFSSIVDSSEYQIESDSDDAIYERLGSKMAVRDLVYQMITVSSNLATNLLIDAVGAEHVQRTVERLGGDGIEVLRGVEDLTAFQAGKNNAATSYGLAELFHALMRSEAVSPGADRAVVDIHLEQQFTDMIPAGLPRSARAAHKTGSITRIHHDAGIVYPEDGEPYVLVILTEGLEENERSAELGAALAARVHRHLRG